MIGYLSGSITGHPNYRREFSDAAAKLRALGYHVINPAELCQVLPGEQMSYEAILQIDLELLNRADYLVQLPGWESSKGACIEYGYALGAGILVVLLEEILKDGGCYGLE